LQHLTETYSIVTKRYVICFTGKTIILVLKGSQWLHQGRDVLVLSTPPGEDKDAMLFETDGRAVSLLIEHHLQQICKTLPPAQQPTVSRVAIQCKLKTHENISERSDESSDIFFVTRFKYEWCDEDVRKVASKACEGKLNIL
jgi:hypothetical protein